MPSELHANDFVTHRNRSGDTYYLHQGRTTEGNPKYFFSRKSEDAYRGPVPPGFEVYENPNAIVSLRRCLASRITAAELSLVQRETKRLASASAYPLVELKKDAIEVHTAEGGDHLADMLSDFGRAFAARSVIEDLATKHRSYHPMLRFTLTEAETREFHAERWCFRGSIDRWIPLSYRPLADLVAEYCPHLGRESFFDLI